ncbi:TonB-dependent receptor plug domain-containing protein [Agarivorans sp.]|uniref:TonB-dependent receptor plug domain-containing protein n=1 Tax=Agarivorans sp. TaxID=1872412 RepID=UPI003CFD869A
MTFAVAAQESLSSLDLESLMSEDVQATSVMKRAQSTFSTPASLYVLSKEDIRASGALTVAESLKLVPGIEVRQLDNNQWAITTRGVAGRHTSKLLVMVDGQSVYNPTFAGVYWETLNVPLYDIERIEVIRGQGGLLWGSNATNGVINIITKNSLDSRGTLLQVSSGDPLNYELALRHGGYLGRTGSYRVYAGLKDVDNSAHGIEMEPHDDAQQQSIGARFDFAPSDDVSVLAQLHYSHTEQSQNLDALSRDVNINVLHQDQFKQDDARVMVRLEHRLSSKSNQMLQASWSLQDGEQLFLKERFQSLDLDYQMNSIFGRAQLDWGLNYRNSYLPFTANYIISSDENLTRLEHYGAFLQLQYALIPNSLNLSFGSKLEHNSFTGWENQPAARLSWQASTNHVLWGAVSQGVRIPSFAEYDYDTALHGVRVGNLYQTGIEAIDNYHLRTVLNGNQQVEPEKSLSYELGYRFNQRPWSLDVSLFHTKSRNVFAVYPNPESVDIQQIAGLLATGQYLDVQQALANSVLEFDVVSNAELDVTGGEAILAWQANDFIKAELGYSQFRYRYNLQANTQPAIGDDSDSRQWLAKLGWQVTQHHALFGLFRSIQSDAYHADNYDVLDLSWTWQVHDSAFLSLSAKNLLAGKHVEYNNYSETFTVSNYIERSFVLRFLAEF